MIIGAPFFDNGQLDEGAVFVYHGSATGISSFSNWSAEGNQAIARFGQSVSTAGDLNGDGFSDVIIGAPFYDSGQANEGAAFVYFGSATGIVVRMTVSCWKDRTGSAHNLDSR
ncbi:MAG: FG-GAP repeat protein [Flavobacteriales bacterium]|nr:FG-GAP repeat protein [Flavobacteriales bacterium]